MTVADDEPTRGVTELLDHPRALPVAIGIGALLRGVHLSAVKGSPLFADLQWDAKTYDAWAAEIAAGNTGGGAFWLDPLYAYVLGALYRVFGHQLLVPRLFGLACGVATVWIVSRTA